MPHSQHPDDSAQSSDSLIAEIFELVRFFSRLPIPKLGEWDRLDKAPDFRMSARSIPLAGAVITLPSLIVLVVLSASALPASVVALLTVAVLVAVQGCLHEDGLADVFDGFFGGHTAERRLEIMKDSRIGAFGAAALVLSLSLRWLLVAALLERFSGFGAALGFLAAETAGRLGMVWIWHLMPPAYQGGLSTRFGIPNKKAAMRASEITAALVLLSLFALSFWQFVLGSVVSALLVWGLSFVAKSKIKGITGDVLGATQQIGSLGFLLGVLSL